MKTILFALLFASLSTLSSIFVNASSFTLAFPVDPDFESDGDSLPSPTIWVDPIGTASDGSATTYILNEIDSGDVALFGDVQTGTTVVTTSLTMIASASGYIFPDLNPSSALDSVSAACTLDSSSSVVCVQVGAEGGTALATITETGSASLLVMPISTPTQTATSGSGFSSGSGVSSGSSSPSGSRAPSGRGSSTGSSSPSPTASGSGSKNGAGQVGPRLFGSVIAGLLAGGFLVV